MRSPDVPSSRVVCGTCGRDNPSHLVFCQDCGARLRPRIAPPTPPIGLTRDGGAAADDSEADVRAAADVPKRRPSAPEFELAPAAPEISQQVTCSSCGSTCRAGMKYCIT